MILIGAPTNIAKDYCIDEYVDNIKQMNHPVILVDNSRDPDYHRKFHHMGIMCEYVSPKGKTLQQVIAESNNRLRLRALQMGADLMIIESDIIPPINIAEYLDIFSLPVLSAMYFLFDGDKRTMNVQLMESDKWQQRNVRMMDMLETSAFADGSIKEVFACGLGCTLIRNEVLQGITFRHRDIEGEDSAVNTFPDTYFYSDLQRAGVGAFVDTGMFVDHLRDGSGNLKNTYVQ